MNQKGLAPLIVPLIIAGAVLIGSFMIAYKPMINCSFGQGESPKETITRWDTEVAQGKITPTEFSDLVDGLIAVDEMRPEQCRYFARLDK